MASNSAVTERLKQLAKDPNASQKARDLANIGLNAATPDLIQANALQTRADSDTDRIDFGTRLGEYANESCWIHVMMYEMGRDQHVGDMETILLGAKGVTINSNLLTIPPKPGTKKFFPRIQKLCQDILKKPSKDEESVLLAVSAHVLLARCSMLQREIGKAVLRVGSAIKLMPTDPLLYKLRGAYYSLQGNCEASTRDFLKYREMADAHNLDVPEDIQLLLDLDNTYALGMQYSQFRPKESVREMKDFVARVLGDGPEKPLMRDMDKLLAVSAQYVLVTFLGVRTDPAQKKEAKSIFKRAEAAEIELRKRNPTAHSQVDMAFKLSAQTWAVDYSPTLGSERGCYLCHTTDYTLKQCGKCRSVAYCSTACQKRDWKAHKKVCAKLATEKSSLLRDETEAISLLIAKSAEERDQAQNIRKFQPNAHAPTDLS